MNAERIPVSFDIAVRVLGWPVMDDGFGKRALGGKQTLWFVKGENYALLTSHNANDDFGLAILLAIAKDEPIIEV